MEQETIDAYGGEEKIRMLADMANNPAYIEMLNSQEEDAINNALGALDPLDNVKMTLSMLTVKMAREHRYIVQNAAKLMEQWDQAPATESRITGRELQYQNRGRR